MTTDAPNAKPRRLKRILFFSGFVGVFVGVLWLVQAILLSAAVRSGAGWLCEKNGLEFQAKSVRWGIGEPLVVEGLVIREFGSAVYGSMLEAGRVEIVPNSIWDIVAGGRAVVDEIMLARVYAFVDLRNGGRTPGRPSGKPGSWASAGAFVREWVADPAKIESTGTTVDVLSDMSRLVLEGVDVQLEKGRNGGFSCDLAEVSIGTKTRRYGPLSAKAAWNGKSLALADMEILPGLVFREVGIRTSRLRDIAIGCRASVFGGELRGDLELRDSASGRIWDIAVAGTGIGLGGVAAALELPVAEASGRISEVKFTFRGEAGRPADAEASLRVLAGDFEWNNQKCRMLEIGSSLIQRRLIVSNFVFEQEGNTVRSNGELSIAEGWENIAESPFLINIRAGITSPEALAKLLGVELDGVRGRIDVEGSVSGRPGVLDGFLEVQAEEIVGRGVAAERIDVEMLFLKKRIELAACTIVSGHDILRAGGSVGIAPPHDYSAWVAARVEDVSKYAQTAPGSLADIASSGSMDLEWKGEGNLEKNTGTFGVSLGDFVSRWSPRGVTGRFDGGYNPGELRLNPVVLENGTLKFAAKAVMSRSGVDLSEMILSATGGKPLLEGAAFLPIDLFALRGEGRWTDAVHRDRPLELAIKTPGKVDLPELVRLIGQNYPLAGSLGMELDCRGLPERLNGSARLSLEGFRYGNNGAPAVTAEFRADMKEGGVQGIGRLNAGGMEALNASVRLDPFFYQQGIAGVGIIKDTAGIEGEIMFPKLNLALLEPMLPSVSRLEGNLSGKLGISGSLGTPAIVGEAEVVDASFAHRLATGATDGVSGRVGFSDGVVAIQELSGRVDGGRFHLSGTCRFNKPWEPDYDLKWVFDDVPLRFAPGMVFPVTGSVDARGGMQSGHLGGKLEIGPAAIGGRISVRPRLSSMKESLPRWTLSLESVAGLAPSLDWSLGIVIGAQKPLELGEGMAECHVEPQLFLGGTAAMPLLTGRVDFSGLRVETPGGALYGGQASLFLLPDNPADPFMLVDANGAIAGFGVRAFAWGALSEGKWLLETPGDGNPHDGFWLLERGMVPMPQMSGGLPPVDVILYPNAAGVAQPVSLRVVDESVWCGGIGLTGSLNFSPGPNALPEEGYRPGFDWAVSPMP